MLDEHVLRRRGPALHPVDDDHVRAGLHRELDVVVRPRRADLDEDRLLPVRDLPQLADLDLEVVRPRPVGMAAGAALVDPLRQVAHRCDAVGDLVTEQHPAAAGLRALADDDLDRVGLAEVVGVHPVAGGEQLVDEDLRVAALLGRHAAVAGRRRGAHLGRAASERLLRGRGEGAEAHARDRDRDLQLQRLLREPGAERDVGVAALAVALERVAGDAGAEEEEVVEVRHLALGAEAADVVDPLPRRPLDLGDHVAVEERRLAQAGLPAVRGPSVRPRVVDREVVELPRRAVAAERRPDRRRRSPPRREGRAPAPHARRASPSRCNPRRVPRPSRARRAAPRRSSRRAPRPRPRRRRGSPSAP